mmetsp:Transcript_47269/g.131991  ORF Transcript_47269/g.131991 Transcript_47269/m.131991 type:complete len:385 (+) Transcript_47269:1-1155(+)
MARGVGHDPNNARAASASAIQKCLLPGRSELDYVDSVATAPIDRRHRRCPTVTNMIHLVIMLVKPIACHGFIIGDRNLAVPPPEEPGATGPMGRWSIVGGELEEAMRAKEGGDVLTREPANEVDENGRAEVREQQSTRSDDDNLCNVASAESGRTLVMGGFLSGVVCTLFVVAVLTRLRFLGNYMPTEDAPSPSMDAKTSGVVADTGETHVEDHESLDKFWPRVCVLAVMLLLQSVSSLILVSFASLLKRKPHIVYFLTMLVGLGGNAGGQSVVLAIRKIALGKEVGLGRQVIIGIGMGIVLAPVAYLRSYVVSPGELEIGLTIAMSVIFLTAAGTTLGTVAPMLFHMFSVDPGHTAPVIQVIMDMVGIWLVCVIAGFVVHYFS